MMRMFLIIDESTTFSSIDIWKLKIRCENLADNSDHKLICWGK